MPPTVGLVGEGSNLAQEIQTVSAPVALTEGIVTRGNRGRKSGGCSKVPPEFQPAKENDIPVAGKKAVWIMHPDHGEMVVAAGKTGP